MPGIDSKRLPLRLKRWLTLLQNNGFKFSGLSRLFILHNTVVTVVGNFVALSFIEPTFLPLCGNTCAVEHNLADSEERDLVNIFASLSLKPSNLPARDAPWKWVTSPFKMCILS
ncbi:unnamed protein product [Prunus armeniaca]